MIRLDSLTPSLLAALRKRERRPAARITYYDLNWQVQEVVTGEVTSDSSFSLDDQGRRQISIRLKNSDGKRTPDPTSDIWYGRFGVEWGLITSQGPEYVHLGRVAATQMGAQVTPPVGWATLGLEDTSALWGTFKDYWVISAENKIRDVIAAIALDGGETADKLNLYPTAEIVGTDMIAAPGDSRWDVAKRVAGAAVEVGTVLNLVKDAMGTTVLYPELDPATTTAPSWTFRVGDGITMSLDKRWEASEFANRVQVYGGSGSVATIFSEVADETAGPYGTQRRGDWCYKWPQGQELDPLITTQERADARRDYLYRLKRTSQEHVQLQGLVVPGFALSDVVRIEEPTVTRTAANYSLRGGYSFGLGPTGSMTINVRRVVQA